MSRPAVAFTGLLAAVTVTTAAAQRVRLEEFLSPTQTYAVEMQWNAGEITRALNAMAAGNAAAMPALTGRVDGVEVRLDTRAYIGQRVRIFLALPVLISGIDSPSDLELRWQSSGEFLPGAVRSGQSALIFEGVVNQPVTGFVMDFLLVLENGAAADAFSLEPFYEIEALP